MHNVLHDEFFGQLKKYLAGHISNAQLEKWVTSNLERILTSGEVSTIELAHELHALFIHENEGLFTAEEIRKIIFSIYNHESRTPWP